MIRRSCNGNVIVVVECKRYDTYSTFENKISISIHKLALLSSFLDLKFQSVHVEKNLTGWNNRVKECLIIKCLTGAIVVEPIGIRSLQHGW